ncbi:Amino acid-polyamine-organocation, partial [Globisporangium splendens]
MPRTTKAQYLHEPPLGDLGGFVGVDTDEASYRKSDPFPTGPSQRVLGTVGIAAITYLFGCGGPIGSEPIISSSGPAIGLPAMIVYPLLVTVPYAYIVAELCTAFPEDGGFTVWVLNAFGSFWGFQVGYWSWIAGIFNSALLPAFLLQVLSESYDVTIESSVVSYIAKVMIAIMLTIPSLLGTKFVARGSVILLFLVLIPVLVFTIWAYARARDFGDLFELKHKNNVYNAETGDDEQVGPITIDWMLLLNTLFWNFDGINMASVFGGEVANPARVYSRAIALTVGLTVATYFVPMPAAILVDDPNWTNFTNDSYPFLAKAIGGPVLQAFFVFSTVCSIAGQYMSSMFCKSIQICGMAENQMLPFFFARRNQQFDTPHNSIFITLFFTLVLLGVDFDDLLPMANAFSGAVQLLIIMAVIRLRKCLPYIPRPTKVPGGIWVLSAIAVLPTVGFCYITFGAFKSLLSAIIIVAFLIPGLFYGFYELRRTSGRAPVVMFV